MTNDRRSHSADRPDPWQQHQISQLKYFRSLTLREKFEAIEGMADTVHRLEFMRKQGKLMPRDRKS